MQANTLVYSSSGNFAIEIKREDTNSGTFATITFKKENIGLQPLVAELNNTREKILDFLQKN
jgi:hypothetical protein